ncbi:MAG: acetoacetate--CoA ligase [Ignavibacteriae bacterium HGW-Ignavibacteriae-1]|jgi:acetoacetyl-CoA synthetase|nr:MAG: acetoacetate--CoA ligase [Ignavibacteriae bacterium HGW-Ignavibacteriae-1]
MKKQALWTPAGENINESNMTQFINFVNLKYGLKLSSYHELYDWSIKYIANFWEDIWQFMDVISEQPYKSVISKINSALPDSDIRNYRWFKGARFNFAENLLKFRDSEIAIAYYSEDSKPIYMTYGQLYEKTAKCALGLKALGVGKGDRVAGYISNNPQAIIAMLATISIGAIWTSTSPDFGVNGVVDRFSQVEPKVLIAVDGYKYNGKTISLAENLNEIHLKLDQTKKIVLINQINADINGFDYISWDKLLDNKAGEIEFEMSEFDHPIYIMYSSGTTGVPKCIVHGAGGTLLQHMKELVLHTNLTDMDKIFYFTTCGWMMWNWLVSSLSVGATVVLYDGSPSYPDLNVMWKMAQEEGISVFGTSPKFLSACQKAGIKPSKSFKLSELKTILSTGSPLSKDNFEWVYSNVKSNVRLSSISGGTDIISCFMLGNPNLPVYSEEIQCRGLGMKVEAWDENGKAVLDSKGELVCTAPFPSMPVYFWNDTDDEKYEAAYFETFPGVWHHGDFITITENGGIIVHGRSDATLNPGGVRIGTSEIYRIVEAMDEISDSIVIGLPKENDVEIVLFVVLKNDGELTTELVNKIQTEIKTNLTARHIPKIIHQISEVPVTLNGKKVELAVLNVLTGIEVKNKTSIANQDSLLQFEKIRALI